MKAARNIPMTVLVNFLLIVGLVGMAAPFVWMLSTSFKGTKDIFRYPPQWIPQEPTLDNYRKLFRTVNIGRPLMNTVITAVSITGLSLIICSMAGYAFAKFEFPGKNVLFMGVLGTLMVPGQITMIPVFLLLKKLGLLNTYSGLVLPGIASAFGIFFMRQFMVTLPNELLEAARIDGAGEFFIFNRIVLPLCKPALATLGILNFTGSWNNFLWPLIISTDESMYTLPVAVANLAGQYATEYGLQMAGSVMVIMPIVIFFLFAQQWFMEGVAMTGMKG
ncbi:MAG TPA: carbohydrate ABC transporter permease [Bacillota bacterium]|nr:carbohydrate ABC transporter permease [Bacillota bacterium]HOO29888.1 carbohydrate ABC transporter permease [Bacillota bacterium]HPZ14119.1 carbohydrate ABC transporter permease [Bacillota bacterium]HQD80770.1 carbohydrate ABC transporter permease [Bacillota bacterium]